MAHNFATLIRAPRPPIVQAGEGRRMEVGARAREGQRPPRCPLCHDDVLVYEEQIRACLDCEAIHHLVCWGQHESRCASCGRSTLAKPEAPPAPRMDAMDIARRLDAEQTAREQAAIAALTCPACSRRVDYHLDPAERCPSCREPYHLACAPDGSACRVAGCKGVIRHTKLKVVPWGNGYTLVQEHTWGECFVFLVGFALLVLFMAAGG
jgi:hypothetical protein